MPMDDRDIRYTSALVQSFVTKLPYHLPYPVTDNDSTRPLFLGFSLTKYMSFQSATENSCIKQCL